MYYYYLCTSENIFSDNREKSCLGNSENCKTLGKRLEIELECITCYNVTCFGKKTTRVNRK